jgi:hypothetical protein
MSRREDREMWNGVVVDPLTESFLRIAVDPCEIEEFRPSLRGFFHDARNRLNMIKLGLYIGTRTGLATQTELWRELDLQYQSLESLLERVQSLIQPGSFDPCAADLGECLNGRRATWQSWFEAEDRRLEWCPPPEPARGRFDPRRLLTALDALLTWRAEVGECGGAARLSWSIDETRLRIDWIEALSPAGRKAEARETRALSMALPLLARVMTTHGGSLKLEHRDRFVLQLHWPICPVSSGDLDPACHMALG